MKRGGPLQRKTPLKQGKPLRARIPQRPEKVERVITLPTLRPVRAGVIATISGDVRALTKPVALRNRRLLDLARGRPCLLRIEGLCNRDPQTTVAAHSNWGIHGKAGARKADDQWTVWSCSACHAWLDQGSAAEVLKRSAFMAAHISQLAQWHGIADASTEKPADRAAARWALERVAEAKSPANDPLYLKESNR